MDTLPAQPPIPSISDLMSRIRQTYQAFSRGYPEDRGEIVMSEPAAKFTQSAAKAIIGAVQDFTGQAIDQTGQPSHKRSYLDRIFIAKITGNNGSSPYHYSWTEQWDTSGGLADMPQGRFGTTGTDHAVNGWESLNYDGPVKSGTIVWMRLTFDDQTPPNPVWTFFYLDQTVGKFCTQADATFPSCAGATKPIYTDVATNITKTYGLSDDFLIYQAQNGGVPCDPHSVRK